MLNPAASRSQFPALDRVINGRPVIYLDGPGGTQAPESVSMAMAGVLQGGVSNLGGGFATSRIADAIVDEARQAVADLINASHPGEIVFGQNMTSLTFAISRAIARTWQPGDEIVVTRLDHDANITPWLRAAEERGVVVKWLDFLPGKGCRLEYEGLEQVLNARTRLVAVTHAANALGTIVDVARVVEAAHSVGARVFVDAVHLAPHRLIDVQMLDCDYLVASAYKFFGPHTGFLYGRKEILAGLEAYKVRPAPSDPPGKWETGTQSFESLAGVTAAIDYLASLGRTTPDMSRRQALGVAFAAISAYEQQIIDRFLSAVSERSFLRLFGPGADNRTPTFALAVDGLSTAEVQLRLGERGIFVWAGHYYAVEVMKRLGVLESGGLVRIGFVHYNTMDELDCLIAELQRLVL